MNKELARAQALEAMFNSSGWKYAEEELRGFIATLKQIDPEMLDEPDIKQSIRDKINVAAALEHWIDELKGDIENQKVVKEPLKEKRIIERR
tara:strand:+ start:491 stop:766 length:276 start_codon:yes stop_codon:yes gene_type:complete